MKFYRGGQLVRVDMIHRYQYVVVEGKDRIRSFQKNREDAEDVAEGIRQDIGGEIRKLSAALEQDTVTHLQEPTGFIKKIWQVYKSPSEIAAAIRGLQQRRASVRVEPLEVRD